LKFRNGYWGCLAWFHATAGDERQTEEAVRKALEIDDSDGSRYFFRRDIGFDPYRAKPWFIKFVGETLAEE
jgi:hypothetical protein